MIDDMPELSRDDEVFLKELQVMYARFIESDKQELKLEPMNSYKRRLAHKLGTKFRIESTSIGEDDRRAVVLKKTDKILSNDKAFVVVNATQINKTLSAFGHEEKIAKKILIIGGGNIGFNLSLIHI